VLKTTNISIAEGISNSNINCIYQDKYGFMWFGTEDGLNKYDGYSFKIFKNVPGNPKSIIDNGIWGVDEDKNGNLWIATNQGVSMYDRRRNEFTNFNLDSLITDRFSSQVLCSSVLTDSKDNIWVGTIGGGVIRYNKDLSKFEKIAVSANVAKSDNDIVLPLIEYNNSIYCGDFRYGLTEYDASIDSFKVVKYGHSEEGFDFKDYEERITNFHIDGTNTLWIVTEEGVYKYNAASNELKVVHKYKRHDIFDLWKIYTGIAEDKEGNIWIGKDMRGILKFDGVSDDFSDIPFGIEYTNKPGTYNRLVRSFFVDNTGIIWIGTLNDGVYKYDPASEPFTHYKHDPKNKFSLGGNEIFGITESKIKSNTIYVGTRGAGLYSFDSETKQFKSIKQEFLSDVFGGSVRSILENEDGSLYLGTWGDGLYQYFPGRSSRLITKWDSLSNASLSNNLIRNILKDEDGLLWIGTNSGLNVYDPVYKKIKRIYEKKDARYPQELIDLIREKNRKKQSIAEILKVGNDANLSKEFLIERPRDYLVTNVGEGTRSDRDNADYGWLESAAGDTVWSSRKYDDSFVLNGNNKNRITTALLRLKPGKYYLKYISDDSHSYGKWNAAPPLDSLLWGVQVLSLADDEIENAERLLLESKTQTYISGSNIRSLHFDNNQKNIIWIGTDAEGLDKFDKTTGKVVNYRNIPGQNSVSNNSIQFIHQDDEGILWLATNSGLDKFDPAKEKFLVYTEEDGLPTNYIASILADEFDNLWIATRNGLSRMTMNGNKATFVNYDSKDGLGGSDYIALVALKASNGLLYFGGEHGLNEFAPGKMNNQPPDLVFTDLKIGNKSYLNLAKEDEELPSIFDSSVFEFEYNQNDLTFEFAALHYGRADKNQYAHFLEGYDKEWVYDNKKLATYTNLDPGEYRFHFKGSNSDGVWNNEGKVLEIIISPPWWQTIFAYISYVFIFTGIVFGIDRIQRHRLLGRERAMATLREAELRAETAELQAKAAEAQAQVMQIENDRKTQELEEARELQLSMLPEKLPELPNLDIAVYMKTATEVGGDYYDFNVAMDGTLTVVLGDATGHGMKAGTMVTTAKSLFHSYSGNKDILFTFHEMTRCIKQMRMQSLSMCLTMLKIKGAQLTMSAAGMPPVFIFRRESRLIEEHLMKGMPLGTMNNFPYEIKEMKLNSGDALLILSDGLPELQNNNGELYGYKRVRNKFEEVAEGTPEEIISCLKDDGSAWVNDEDPEDDVTFVVIKVK